MSRRLLMLEIDHRRSLSALQTVATKYSQAKAIIRVLSKHAKVMEYIRAVDPELFSMLKEFLR